MHPPTCCGGCCVNCCAEGNPCFGKGCCKLPFHIFDYEEKDTAGNENYIGKILKKPKSLMTEMFTDANAFDVDFPKDATPAQKGMLVGSAIFMNAIYFEGVTSCFLLYHKMLYINGRRKFISYIFVFRLFL